MTNHVTTLHVKCLSDVLYLDCLEILKNGEGCNPGYLEEGPTGITSTATPVPSACN